MFFQNTKTISRRRKGQIWHLTFHIQKKKNRENSYFPFRFGDYIRRVRHEALNKATRRIPFVNKGNFSLLTPLIIFASLQWKKWRESQPIFLRRGAQKAFAESTMNILHCTAIRLNFCVTQRRIFTGAVCRVTKVGFG